MKSRPPEFLPRSLRSPVHPRRSHSSPSSQRLRCSSKLTFIVGRIYRYQFPRQRATIGKRRQPTKETPADRVKQLKKKQLLSGKIGTPQTHTPIGKFLRTLRGHLQRLPGILRRKKTSGHQSDNLGGVGLDTTTSSETYVSRSSWPPRPATPYPYNELSQITESQTHLLPSTPHTPNHQSPILRQKKSYL